MRKFIENYRGIDIYYYERFGFYDSCVYEHDYGDTIEMVRSRIDEYIEFNKGFKPIWVHENTNLLQWSVKGDAKSEYTIYGMLRVVGIRPDGVLLCDEDGEIRELSNGNYFLRDDETGKIISHIYDLYRNGRPMEEILVYDGFLNKVFVRELRYMYASYGKLFRPRVGRGDKLDKFMRYSSNYGFVIYRRELVDLGMGLFLKEDGDFYVLEYHRVSDNEVRPYGKDVCPISMCYHVLYSVKNFDNSERIEEGEILSLVGREEGVEWRVEFDENGKLRLKE